MTPAWTVVFKTCPGAHLPSYAMGNGSIWYPLFRSLGGSGADLDGFKQRRPNRDWKPEHSSP